MREAGQRIKTLEDRPAVPPRLEIYLQAYYDLVSESQSGVVTWRSVVLYAADLGYSHMAEFMFDVIRFAQGRVAEWTKSNSQSGR